MQNAKITGIASYVPDYVLTNDELSHMVDTNDEWITTRVGIKERRILKGGETGSSDLGVKAVAELLKKTGVKPSEVDLLICATSNPDYRFPSTASIVLEKLGIKTAYGYAQMFMGDVGSLGLGGVLAFLAVLCKQELPI